MDIKNVITTEIERLELKFETEKVLYLEMLNMETIYFDFNSLITINKTKTKISTLKWVLENFEDD